MLDVQERKGVRVRCAQEVGQLGRVLAPLAEARVNVEAINAITLNDEGYLTIVTDNNRKAIDLWNKAGLVAEEVDLLGIELDNRPGELATVANKLGQARIDVRWVNSSVRSGQDRAVMYLSTSDNREALRRIRG